MVISKTMDLFTVEKNLMRTLTMANSIGFDLSALKLFDKNLRRLSKLEKNNLMQEGFKKSADMLRDEVRKRVPAGKGVLKEDIKSGATAKTGQVFIRGRNLSPQKVDLLEYGTSKIPAHPFIRPAFDANQNRAEKICITGIITSIDEIFIK